jgi:hypothetical protein
MTFLYQLGEYQWRLNCFRSSHRMLGRQSARHARALTGQNEQEARRGRSMCRRRHVYRDVH